MRDAPIVEISRVREDVKKQISFDSLMIDDPENSEDYEGYVELITEILASCRKSFWIAGAEHPTEYVKERFRKLDRGAIEMVELGIRDNTTEVRNYKQYVLAALFNAASMKNLYFKIRVNHDMAYYDAGVS